MLNVTHRVVSFLTQGLKFKQLGQRYTRQSYIPNIKDQGLLVSYKKISVSFPYIGVCQASVCKAGDNFWPRAFI